MALGSSVWTIAALYLSNNCIVFIFVSTHYTSSQQTIRDKVEVFWVVRPRNVAVGYQRFGGPSCLHLHEVELFCVVTLCSVVVGYFPVPTYLSTYQPQHYTASKPTRTRL
jgi:hypothetical protein